jgi:hypothetical protein
MIIPVVSKTSSALLGYVRNARIVIFSTFTDARVVEA